jgi:hypothetical protein
MIQIFFIIKMNDQLSKIFYSPETGFRSYQKLADMLGNVYPIADVKKWYYNQPVNQIFHKINNESNIPFSSDHPGVSFFTL